MLEGRHPSANNVSGTTTGNVLHVTASFNKANHLSSTQREGYSLKPEDLFNGSKSLKLTPCSNVTT